MLRTYFSSAEGIVNLGGLDMIKNLSLVLLVIRPKVFKRVWLVTSSVNLSLKWQGSCLARVLKG
jgi:hypothetical protein